MGLWDLSLRHKLPLLGGLLIVVTAVTVTTSNLLQVRENIRKNMLARSEILGRSLVRTLYSAVSQDDVWRAYEIINFPMTAEQRHPTFQLESMIVLDARQRVFISSQPRRYPLQTEPADLGPEFRQLAARLKHNDGRVVIQDTERIHLAIPLVAEGVTLGTLVLTHPADYFQASFDRVLRRNAWTTLVVLLVLLPLTWLLGRRMASPLELLAERMTELGSKPPPPPAGGHLSASR
jgi:hypothetical protein